MKKACALEIMERIEGTLIADLKSLKIVAEERSNSKTLQEKLPGGFNYLLHISALIACETLGYMIKKDSEVGRSAENIKYFISSTYIKESAFKKDDYLNVLTSLRTNLAHVFGITNMALDSVSGDISLCVGGLSKAPLMSDKSHVTFNGVKFADEVINGFGLIKADVLKQKDKKLIEIIEENT